MFGIDFVFIVFDGPLLVVTVPRKVVFFSGTSGLGTGRVGGDGGSPGSLIFKEDSVE